MSAVETRRARQQRVPDAEVDRGGLDSAFAREERDAQVPVGEQRQLRVGFLDDAAKHVLGRHVEPTGERQRAGVGIAGSGGGGGTGGAGFGGGGCGGGGCVCADAPPVKVRAPLLAAAVSVCALAEAASRSTMAAPQAHALVVQSSEHTCHHDHATHLE